MRSPRAIRSVTAVAGLLIREIFRKKDFYVALILMAVVLFYAGQMSFYNVKNISRYLTEIGLSLIFLLSAILTVCLAARQYPSEAQNRTIQVLLSKPISRFEFLAGKFVGAFLAGAACFTIYYAVFLVLALQKSASVSPVVGFETFYLFILSLMVLAAMATGISYRLTVSANVTLSLVVYLLMNFYGPGLRQATQKLFWINRILGELFYYAMPHFEFFDLRQRLIHEWEPLPVSLIALLTLYAACYALFFLLLGWNLFRKRFL